MGYVIAAVLVLLIVAAAVAFFVVNAASRQRQSAAADSGHGGGTPGSEAAIVAPDEASPLGDTDQHSDATGDEGRTVPDDDRRPRTAGSVPAAGEGGVGGEAEGRPADADADRPSTPESERLSNRPR